MGNVRAARDSVSRYVVIARRRGLAWPARIQPVTTTDAQPDRFDLKSLDVADRRRAELRLRQRREQSLRDGRDALDGQVEGGGALAGAGRW